MFVLVLLKDTLRIATEDVTQLQSDVLQRIRFELHDKYCNKVIPDLGLCIVVHSIIAYDEPQLFHTDPCPYVRCTFRLVVWQPTNNEIITAKITTTDATKIVLSVDFFDNIIIKASQLPQDSTFDPEEKVWVWNNDGQQYYFDPGMTVRFKVLNSSFHNNLVKNSSNASTNPTKPTNLPPQGDHDISTTEQKALQHGYLYSSGNTASGSTLAPTPLSNAASSSTANTPGYNAPFTVYGDMSEAGLGPVEWWD